MDGALRKIVPSGESRPATGACQPTDVGEIINVRETKSQFHTTALGLPSPGTPGRGEQAPDANGIGAHSSSDLAQVFHCQRNQRRPSRKQPSAQAARMAPRQATSEKVAPSSMLSRRASLSCVSGNA